ncbi:hypothetical protein CB1_000689035 [Camelus ferus]|nr:hypothetical protein CB1_000689035 [Camelus ferus]
MFQHLLLGYERSEESYLVVPKPQPSAALTNSPAPSLPPRTAQAPCQLQAARFQQPAVPTSNCSSKILRGGTEIPRKISAEGHGTANVQAWEEDHPCPLANSEISTSTNQSRNPPRPRGRTSLDQASLQSLKDSLTARSRATVASASATGSPARLHQESKCSPTGPRGPRCGEHGPRGPRCGEHGEEPKPGTAPPRVALCPPVYLQWSPGLSKGGSAHRGAPDRCLT